jgi:hypothetical protein
MLLLAMQQLVQCSRLVLGLLHQEASQLQAASCSSAILQVMP